MTQSGHKRLYFELFMVSMLSLYTELFFIRILSSNFRVFTVFKTFPLIVCFIGLGLGMAKSGNKLFKWTPVALFLTCLILSLGTVTDWSLYGFPSSNNFAWQCLGYMNADRQGSIYLYLVELPLLLAGPWLVCYCIGDRLGALFAELPTLPAYSADLLGATFGSVLFAVFSFCQLPPHALILVQLLVLFIFAVWPHIKKPIAWAATACLLLTLLPAMLLSEGRFVPMFPKLQAACNVDHRIYWSPYQRIQLDVMHLKDSNQLVGLEVGVNRVHYQLFLDDLIERNTISDPFVRELLDERHVQYAVPYKLMQNQKLDDILVVGAGSGSNVKAACENGARHIDAVEIDPVIIKIGREFNKYYADQRVNVVCDDARHYFNSCQKKYDLIIFGTLDSHSIAGQGSSVRLDAYVYTKQSIEAAKKLLKPDGILYLDFGKMTPWIESRLVQTSKAAAGPNTLISINKASRVWGYGLLTAICGKPVDNGLVHLPDTWGAPNISTNSISHPVLTDDWPYLYVEPDVIDCPYLIVVLEFFIFALCTSGKVLPEVKKPRNAQLFFLGAGFLLMELASVARLSLLFGTTWLTTAIVINGILLLVYLSNRYVISHRAYVQNNQTSVYMFTLASLVLSSIVPIDALLKVAQSIPVLGPIAMVVFVLLPICLASLIFPVAFANSESASKALAINLLGSFLGGLLEYLSFYLGNSGLIMLGAILYGISFFCHLRAGRLPKIEPVLSPGIPTGATE